MAFNFLEKKRIEHVVGGFCKQRISDHLRDQINVFYEVRGYDVIIIETRLQYMKSKDWIEIPIARFKYDPETLYWELYWMSESNNWQKYIGLEPTRNLQSIIDEILNDPQQVFWR